MPLCKQCYRLHWNYKFPTVTIAVNPKWKCIFKLGVFLALNEPFWDDEAHKHNYYTYRKGSECVTLLASWLFIWLLAFLKISLGEPKHKKTHPPIKSINRWSNSTSQWLFHFKSSCHSRCVGTRKNVHHQCLNNSDNLTVNVSERLRGDRCCRSYCYTLSSRIICARGSLSDLRAAAATTMDMWVWEWSDEWRVPHVFLSCGQSGTEKPWALAILTCT